MLSDLNTMQTKIYYFLCDYVNENGYAPSVREIGDNVGLKSTSSVHSHLKKLEEQGYIIRKIECPRAIKIV